MVHRRGGLLSTSLTFASSNSFVFFSSLSVLGSPAEYAMRLPSCDQRNVCTEFLALVNCTASPPSEGMIQICVSSSRSERNAMCLPSGDQRGSCSDLVEKVH